MNKAKPFIDFIITQKCTLRCTYCSQSKADAKVLNDAPREVIEGFFTMLQNLDRDFEITITGGEPLLHPDFFEILQRLKQLGFKVAIVSNFSFPVKKYTEIVDILGENLSFLMLSCHTSSAKNLDDYINRVLAVRSYTKSSTRMRVCAPLWDGNMAQLEYLKNKLTGEQIEFEAQHIRIKNKFISYSEQESEFLKLCNAAPNKDLATFGRLCNAGCLSAVIYENGKVYRCYSSRHIKTHYLGNVAQGNIDFYKNALPCPLFGCTCPKPYVYSMITERRDYFKGALSLLLNGCYFVATKIKNILRI